MAGANCTQPAQCQAATAWQSDLHFAMGYQHLPWVQLSALQCQEATILRPSFPLHRPETCGAMQHSWPWSCVCLLCLHRDQATWIPSLCFYMCLQLTLPLLWT